MNTSKLRLQFYKPNPSNKGSALGVNFDPENQALYFNLLKQDGWNTETKNGSFKGSRGQNDKEVKVKFSLVEAAGILNFLNHQIEFSFFHTSPKGTVTGKVTTYKDGASIAINKGKKDEGGTGFVIGLNAAESTLLGIFIEEGIRQCLSQEVTIEKEVE